MPTGAHSAVTPVALAVSDDRHPDTHRVFRVTRDDHGGDTPHEIDGPGALVGAIVVTDAGRYEAYRFCVGWNSRLLGRFGSADEALARFHTISDGELLRLPCCCHPSPQAARIRRDGSTGAATVTIRCPACGAEREIDPARHGTTFLCASCRREKRKTEIERGDAPP